MRLYVSSWCLWMVGCGSTLPETVTYTEHVQPILERHCVRCHAEGGPLYAGVGVEQYRNARSTRIRSVCTALDQGTVDAYGDVLRSEATPEAGPCADWVVGSMPPGAKFRLTQDERELLALWVAQGAPE